MTMMNKKESTPGAAFAVRHRANIVTTRNSNQTQPTQRDNLPPVTSIADWLIDSGATAHMTHYIDDFNGYLKPYESLVETANGGVIHVTHRGSVDIYLNDVFTKGNSLIIQVNNVLYVPGLTRRLISVHEWNACGGQILHLQDRTRVEVYDDNDEIYAIIYLPPCPGATDSTTEMHAAKERRKDRETLSPSPTKICQSLLHRRLGHRSMSTILMADEDDMWNDVDVIQDREEFCETCKITTARKSNRGANPLEELGEVVPGQFVMTDIVTNPTQRSITADSHFKYYLVILDAASRLFVPMGIQDKRPRTIFEAIQDWALTFGPSKLYNLSRLEQVHGDFDTSFRSVEFTHLAAEANIRLSFAAPRHQEQNGLCEANWRSIRDLAYALMNQAH
jgi:transposase InsO family protein